MALLQEDTQHGQSDTCHTRIDNHRPDIKLQTPSGRSASTGNQNRDQLNDRTRDNRVKEAQSGYHLQKGVGDATPCMDRHVHHQLNNQEDIDERAKSLWLNAV